jgi:serralysin
VNINLAPGSYSKFSAVQLANLDSFENVFARGNIFNALLFKGDLRSLIENARGGSGSDTIRGNQAENVLYGNNGNDRLFGLDGKDKLFGGAGNDTLDGGNDNDVLVGGAGADTLIGGAGSDTASYAGATVGVTASLAKPSINTNDAQGDTYSSIENLTGSSFNDRLIGNGSANILNGGAGNDTLDGGAGADKLFGGDGSDTASYASATTGVTASLTTPSNNTNDARGDTYSSIENLVGSRFADRLFGDSGVNRINGAQGNDTLTGGAGADDFVFAAGYGRDTITDFQNNVDDIDLRTYGFSSLSTVLSKSFQVGADVEIRLSTTDVIILKNFTKANLDAADFLL